MAVILHHLMLLPVILPLVAGALLLFLNERRRLAKALIALSASGLLIAAAIALVCRAQELAPIAEVYNLGNWAAPFGIIFVLDRLAAAFLLMAAIIAFAALIYASAHWGKAGAHFYSFAMFFLAGVNGAFLTGDIFNLFVFFEIMLTASYALLMHGGGLPRVKAGMQFVTINLLASSCFLIGAALLYGGAGTLNMADIAAKLPLLSSDNLLICQIGIGILGIAFLIKAAMWPLCFWADKTYSSAAAPVGALFAITGKVGLYAILRLSLLWLGADKTGLHEAACAALFYGGLVTLIFGLLGALAAETLPRIAANCVLISAGTVLAAIGLNHPALTGIAVYYIISSTFALAAFFLLAEPACRGHDTAADMIEVTTEVYGESEEEEEESERGFLIPAATAILGACFGLCAIVLIGMPPLSGFLAKFMMISSALAPNGLGSEGGAAVYIMPDMRAWLFTICLLLGGFALLITFVRSGIRLFWAPEEEDIPPVRLTEIIPIAGLLALCLAMTAAAAPVMHYLSAMGAELHSPANYIHSVLGNAAELR